MPDSSCSPTERVVDPAELARHVTKQSCWIVIQGHVYDVTSFHHPGGWNRLFEFAGRDATASFNAIGHSDTANAHLCTMLVGRLPDVPRDSAVDQRYQQGGQPPVSGASSSSFRALRGGLDHRPAKTKEHLWSTRCRGFLPVRDPQVHLDAPYDLLTALVMKLPSSLASGTFCQLVNDAAPRFPAIQEAIESEESDDVLERIHSLIGYIGKAYVHHGVVENGMHYVPEFIAGPWLAVSERLHREPTIDYSDCVLYNWERIDHDGPITPDNIRILNRFTGLLDEEWFLKTHVIIESEARGVVSAIYDGFNAVKQGNVPDLLASLSWLEQGIAHVANNCLRIMFERREDDGAFCEPHMFYHRFRPFIGSWTACFEGHYENTQKLEELRKNLEMVESLSNGSDGLPDLEPHHAHLVKSICALQKRRSLCGPSGAMSTILPCCDAFLGVDMTNEQLANLLARFETYAPVRHRELLQEVRQYPARQFILQLRERGDCHVDSLTDHFNACLRRVLDFRWRHLGFIEQYVLLPAGSKSASGTGGTPAFAYLNQHINDTEAAVIKAPESGSDPGCKPEAAVEQLKVAGSLAQDGGLWEVTEKAGLLPSEAPLALDCVPREWKDISELLYLMPGACVPPASFRKLVVQRIPSLPKDIANVVGSGSEERCRASLAYLTAGWQAAGEPEPVPTPLRNLFIQISQHLKRAPRLSLTDYFLYNWQMIAGGNAGEDGEDTGPAQKKLKLAIPRLKTFQAVQPLQRFLCVEEEDWFCRLHVTLASETGGVVRAVNRCYSARDGERVGALQSLAQAIEVLVNVHQAFGIGKSIDAEMPAVHPGVLMQRLRRFLPFVPELSLQKPVFHAAQVYCSSGVDQSCLLHVLGVKKGDHAMQRLRDWQESTEGGLPGAHLTYLKQLQERESLRMQVDREAQSKTLAVQDLGRLELAHNSCIDVLSRLFARRFELVRKVLGADVLNDHWKREWALIQEARLHLLIYRRQML